VSLAFGRFSRLSGLVLDVGCGPQEWPAHFDVAQPGTVFVGVDPLVGDAPGRYLRVRALAEHLPFRRLFDQVLFVGSIDHLVDPRQALREARRVLTPGGVISVCVGEKADDAPPPTVSHDWYANLRRPAGAQDVFHFKRMGESEVVHIFSTTGLEIEEHVVESVDAFRTRHFFRLVPDGRDPDR